jgi:hypothetical protein
MVFAINCGPEGAANSFTNFTNAAKATKGKLGGASPSPDTTVYPAAYGTYTVPPPPTQAVVTQTVVLNPSSSWLTTYTSYAGSPGPTPVAAEGTTHTVIVGGPGKLVYDPPMVAAEPRDKVVFEL